MSNRPTNARTIHQTVRAVDLSKTSPMRDDASFTEGLREIEGYFSIVSISTKLNVVEVLAFEILLRYDTILLEVRSARRNETDMPFLR